jgi:23S rRNA (guanosine2251-2'-O)-methyltransferase
MKYQKDRKSPANLIMGRNAIEETLKYNSKNILKISLLDSNDPRQIKILTLMESKNIPYSFVSRRDLDRMAGSESHQGIVAKLKSRNFFTTKELLNSLKDRETSTILILDGIQDPQNMGAILRSGACFDVDGVIFSKNKSCDITAVVSKTSVGASEILNLVKVSNLHDSVLKLIEADYEIYVADGSKGATPINDVRYGKRVAIIMGSEQNGVQPLLKKLATQIVAIPMIGKISSLNVSQATAIMLFNRMR